LSYGLALIFDLDGVVVDSMPIHTLAWQRYLAELGIAGNQVERRMHGRRTTRLSATFGGRMSILRRSSNMVPRKRRLFREMIGPQLSARWFRVWWISSHGRGPPPSRWRPNAEPANVDFVLSGTEFVPFFSVIVDGTQVAHAKPAPDVYLRPPNCWVSTRRTALFLKILPWVWRRLVQPECAWWGCLRTSPSSRSIIR
jgi:beta-phosphoglucomutase-like phosphatase (HAD superfamily)